MSWLNNDFWNWKHYCYRLQYYCVDGLCHSCDCMSFEVLTKWNKLLDHNYAHCNCGLLFFVPQLLCHQEEWKPDTPSDKMADCSDGGGQLDAGMLPNHLSLNSLLDPGQVKEEVEEAEETGASILGDILEMEGTEAGEEDASLMEALAECEGKEEEGEEEDESYETEEDEGDDEDSDDEEEGEEESESEESEAEEEEEAAEEEEEEFDLSRAADESIEFGEMPDFSSMMEADGSSLLEGAVSSDVGLKALQDSELMETDAVEVKLEPGTSGEKGGSKKKPSKKRKRKATGKDKDKKTAKKSKKEKRKKKKGKKDSKVDSSTLKPSERRRNIRWVKFNFNLRMFSSSWDKSWKRYSTLV